MVHNQAMTLPVFMQQKRLLTRQGKSNPRPKDEWIEDLTTQIRELISTKVEVILCMDANQEVTGKQVQKLISRPGLIDLVATKLGSNAPETQIRGSKIIDMVLRLPDLEEAVEQVGSLAYHDSIVLDHCDGVWYLH
jgi:hypothetical protein